MAELTEIEVLQFTIFKKMLIELIEDNFNACGNFISGIEKAKDDLEIIKHFKHNNENVFEHLGGSPNQDEIEDLEREIDQLNNEINDLEGQLEDYEEIEGTTLNDNYKLEHFMQYKNDYTEWELEDLLKNGRKYLAK